MSDRETDEIVAQYEEIFRRKQRAFDDLLDSALRLEPVCRNCVFAGPLTYTGNAPYTREWGSCRKRAPHHGPRERIEQYTDAPTATWPTVKHDASCAEFQLTPLRADERKPLERTYWTDKVPWSAWCPREARTDKAREEK